MDDSSLSVLTSAVTLGMVYIVLDTAETYGGPDWLFTYDWLLYLGAVLAAISLYMEYGLSRDEEEASTE